MFSGHFEEIGAGDFSGRFIIIHQQRIYDIQGVIFPIDVDLSFNFGHWLHTFRHKTHNSTLVLNSCICDCLHSFCCVLLGILAVSGRMDMTMEERLGELEASMRRMMENSLRQMREEMTGIITQN